jgi:hypothetical protein
VPACNLERWIKNFNGRPFCCYFLLRGPIREAGSWRSAAIVSTRTREFGIRERGMRCSADVEYCKRVTAYTRQPIYPYTRTTYYASFATSRQSNHCGPGFNILHILVEHAQFARTSSRCPSSHSPPPVTYLKLVGSTPSKLASIYPGISKAQDYPVEPIGPKATQSIGTCQLVTRMGALLRWQPIKARQ